MNKSYSPAKFLAFMILVCLTVVSQIRTKQVLSGAFNAGLFIPGEIDSKTGLNLGIDLEARTYKFGLYLNFTGNFSKEKESVPPYGRNTVLLEIYGGPRWFIGNLEKLNGAIDAGLGFYKFYFEGYGGDGNLGINLGGGLNFPISKKIDMALKGKYHILGKNMFSSWAELFCAFRYYFAK